jgi:peptidyl-prolyl cis-trans isomerase D
LYAGEIFGKGVSRADFNRIYQQVAFGMQNQSMSAGEVNQEAWNRLILLTEAKKLGIRTSDKEVRAEIETFPWLRTKDGQFNVKGYQAFIDYRFKGDAYLFESLIRDDLTVQKLVNQVVPKAVGDPELFDIYKKDKRKISMQYLTFDFPEKEKAPTWTDEELKKFYESHADDFRKPPTFQLDYLMIDLNSFASEVTVSEENLKAYYERYKQYFVDETTKTQQTFEQARTEVEKRYREEQGIFKAQDYATQLRQKIKEVADLEKMADPPRTKFVRTKFLTILEVLKELGWSAQLFSELQKAKPRDVSAPFRTSQGFCILAVPDHAEAYLPPMDEVKDNVKERQITEWRAQLAQKTAEEALNQAQSKKLSLSQLAKTLGKTAQETPLLDRFSTEWANVEAESILEAAFDKKEGELLGPSPAKDGARLFQVTKMQDVTNEEFQKEKEAFRTTYTTQQKERAFSAWFSEVVRRANRKVFELK